MRRSALAHIILLLVCSTGLWAQPSSNLRQLDLALSGDTLDLDSMTIVPGSEILKLNSGKFLDTAHYEINYAASYLVFKPEFLESADKNDKVSLTYRVLNFDLSQTFKHKDIKLIEPDQTLTKDPFIYTPIVNRDEFFQSDGLNKSGSISRGVTLGNNQDLAVNSNLDLQLSGKLNDEVSVLAAVSDNNIPVQPQGNTQRLQEFDQVYVQLYTDRHKLTAGDYRVKSKGNHFLKYNKSLQGGSFESKFPLGHEEESKGYGLLSSRASIAISKGKFAINKIQGIEGNQGPYLLTGVENENFIIVISGTERVYIDGQLLKRGQDYDYIIDYNAAEITFTPNQLITKDKRITVEFQYTDQYYQRSLVQLNAEYSDTKLNLKFNYYNEQDGKNQPLNDLTDEEKEVLGDIGDSLNLAVVPNISTDSSADISSEILYKVEYNDDGFGPDSFFVYSTNPDSAIYRVGFSLVNQGQGDYILAQSAANGKVYQFVPRDPLTGQPTGNYAPVKLLVTPKRRQMVSLGGSYQLTKATSFKFEGALTTNDLNTFSSIDNENNDSYGFLIGVDNQFPLSQRKDPTNLDVGLSLEQLGVDFKEIERFRAVEFFRDWNLPNPDRTNLNGLKNQQNLVEGYLGVSQNQWGFVKYEINSFTDGPDYQGINNKLLSNYQKKKFEFDFKGSYLQSEGQNNSDFLRLRPEVSQGVGPVRVGIIAEQERSRRYFGQSDSLAPESFEWQWWEVYLTNADSGKVNYRASYLEREDFIPSADSTDLSVITFARDANFDIAILQNPLHNFRGRITYRQLSIVDTQLTDLQPEDNILGKLDYQVIFLKRVITSQTYYELGSGLEIKKEVAFIGPLNPGQGNYVWIDENDDGIQQKNEFFPAPSREEGIYTRVLLPTNEFERAYANTFNQVFFIKPEAVWGNASGWKKLAGKFSNKLTYRIDRKSSQREGGYNPFGGNPNDTNLISMTNGVINTLYFNRLNPGFGLELNYRENQTTSLLISGQESRSNIFRGIRSRWNITRRFTLNFEVEEGLRNNRSENFSERNYDIRTEKVAPQLFYQPGVAFRIGGTYEYLVQQNAVDFGGQRAINQTFGIELRYNVAQKGSFQANLDYIDIDYLDPNDLNDVNIAVEMFNGLQPGNNITWDLLYSRNLGNHMQLSINYNGRNSEDARTVHLGGAQVRAFF